MKELFIAGFVTVAAMGTPAAAGGLIGDLIEGACGNCGVGEKLDEAHKDLKNHAPIYKQIEEGVSKGVQKGIEEFNAETHGPMLAAWIEASRQDVLNAGTQPIPPHIFSALAGYFPPDVLSYVRYRSGWGNELALPALSFNFGDASAITLNEVVMFRNESDAQNDIQLWAHELTHVLQYRAWGVLDFAKRYIKDHQGVEAEADSNSNNFVQWRQANQPPQLANTFPQPVNIAPVSASIVCRMNQVNFCLLPVLAPVGGGCQCATPMGIFPGLVTPN
ncbi:DUF4157 domain-containing protein [Sinorhizobium medicae]|uniref:eCIS core domain-containing protein n=1 Tax=Sinorhizobium medicae TaxID=110321 RepID=UPI001297D52F|nr:DUF4157 domain-containing protein [Sinorhizobium medicae]MQX98009.1 DUF4157 domain-containing protein [Sinorhizobium medicae]